jgi:hypothetical protein
VTDIYNFDDNTLQLTVLELYDRSEFPIGQVLGPQRVSSHRASRKHFISVWNSENTEVKHVN